EGNSIAGARAVRRTRGSSEGDSTMNSARTEGIGQRLTRVVVLSLACQVANADPLDLDPSFNGNGKVVTDLKRGPGDSNESATAVATAQDGKIVVVGSTLSGPPNGYDFAVVRYTPDGSIDQTFGTNGRVTTDFSTPLDKAVGSRFSRTER